MSLSDVALGASLHGRSFLTLLDYTSQEIKYLLSLSHYLKKRRQALKAHNVRGDYLANKNIALIFEKASTRTRSAFEVAAYEEGGKVTTIAGNSHMGTKESMEDTAQVLGRMYDGIEFRGFGQDVAEDLAKYSGVPVWNGLTDDYHPTQILADFMTLQESLHDAGAGDVPTLTGRKFVFVGDARSNMGNSLMIGCSKIGMRFVGLCPMELRPREDLVAECKHICTDSKGSVEFFSIEDAEDALAGADCVYTDVWVSMGEEAKMASRIELLRKYQVTESMLRLTKNEQCAFLHCLPAFHDTKTTVGKTVSEKFGLDSMEVTDAVFRSARSRVFSQAENRLHTIKAVMVATLGHGGHLLAKM